MSSNLPPLTPRQRRNAPWNQPDPADRLPVYCQECGFKAEALHEIDDHEHANDRFAETPKDHQPQKRCAVCSPPPGLRQMIEMDKDLPFCEAHDYEDFQTKLEHEQEVRENVNRTERNRR